MPRRNNPPAKFRVGDRVWFLKSMRMCVVAEDYGEVPPHGRCYSVEVMDSGKQLFASEEGLAFLDQQKESQ